MAFAEGTSVPVGRTRGEIETPVFAPRSIVHDPNRPGTSTETIFTCVACLVHDVVDAASGMCRPCWRASVLVPAATREGTGTQ